MMMTKINPSTTPINVTKPLQGVEKTGSTAPSETPILATPRDTVDLTAKKLNKSLTPLEKNTIIHDAKTRAALWSVPFSLVSTIFYALKKPEKLAEKRAEVQQGTMSFSEALRLEEAIRSAQIKATIPGVLLPSVGGLLAWGGYTLFEKPDAPNFNAML